MTNISVNYAINHDNNNLLGFLCIDGGKHVYEVFQIIYELLDAYFRPRNISLPEIEWYKLSDFPLPERRTPMLHEQVDEAIRSLEPLGPREHVSFARDFFQGCDPLMLHVAAKIRSKFFDDQLPAVEGIVFLTAYAALPLKRTLASVEGDLTRFKRRKVATSTPSSIALPETYQSIQTKPDERILDDYPDPDVDVPPISLLYDGFGEFLDIFSAGKDSLPTDEQQRAGLESAVDEFARKMSQLHKSEESMETSGLETINGIFSVFGVDPAQSLIAASIERNVATDGHFSVKYGIANAITEFKNLVARGMYHAQIAGYFAHSLRLAMDKNKEVEDLLKSWRAPCLGIAVIGPYIVFYAIIFLGGKLRVVNLTHGLWCIPCAGDGIYRETLQVAFTAASILVKRIIDEVRSPTMNAHRDLFFPSVSGITKPDAEDQFLKFKIIRRFSEGEHRLLYTAESPEYGEILVKFTRRYSIELHTFCAARGYAPRVYGFQKLPGGWYAVAMEYFPNATRLSGSLRPASMGQEWAKQLRELVQSFHEKDLVHGDLRDPNIICVESKLMLVDFDWGGKEGEASYPTALLCRDLKEGRTGNCLKITKADDIRILNNTLRLIQA